MENNKISVLDYGFVKVIDVLGTDLTVTNSARVSFGKRSEVQKKVVEQSHLEQTVLELTQQGALVLNIAPFHSNLLYVDNRVIEYIDGKDAKLIKYLADHKHHSPFRHCLIQLHCKVPEFIARQWYKHVIGASYSSPDYTEKDHAWNEISMRYTSMEEANFYLPEKCRKQSESNKQCSTDEYVPFINLDGNNIPPQGLMGGVVAMALDVYKKLIEGGVSKEQARMILPLNIYTEFYWTASLQALANFVSLRDHEGSQWEIREYAKVIKTVMEQFFPLSTDALIGVCNDH